MKAFSFSFQYLLEAHEAKEQAAEFALHTAIKDQTLVEREVEAAGQVRAAQVAELEKMIGVIHRSGYANYLRSIEGISKKIEGLKEMVRRHKEQVEACREALRKEMTARRVLENLRERERVEWEQNAQTEEQKQMDELAVGRWSRQVRQI